MAGRPREFDARQALLLAMDLFWRQGYEATSVDDLVAATGLQRGSLYAAFHSKDKLYHLALQAYVGEATAAIGQTLRAPGTPLAKLDRFLAVWPERAERYAGRGCLMTNTIVERAPHDEVSRQVLTALLANLEAALVATISEAKRIGQLPRTLNAKQLAQLLLVVMHGATVLAKLPGGGERIDGAITHMRQHLRQLARPTKITPTPPASRRV